MRFDTKIFSIPPHISTTWDQIASLQISARDEGYPDLVVHLKNGDKVQVPNLNPTLIEGIFALHSKILSIPSEEEKTTSEQDTAPQPKLPPPTDWRSTSSFALLKEAFNPFEVANQFGIDLPIPSKVSILEHDPTMANAPSLPREMLRKLTAIARSLHLAANIAPPEVEMDCNCIHCQIGKAILAGLAQNEHLDEEVDLEDLTFCDWNIQKQSEHSYLVSHKVDSEEYAVTLDPPSCSCQEKNCSHIKSVLESYL
jgi:hypothetical protein